MKPFSYQSYASNMWLVERAAAWHIRSDSMHDAPLDEFSSLWNSESKKRTRSFFDAVA